MPEMLHAGGWLMIPIVLCSIAATAIIIERAWSLRRRRIMPPDLVDEIWRLQRAGELTGERIQTIRAGSPLGRMLASGLANLAYPREVMKEAIADTGRQVVADLERFLNTLGTIAAISPLLGLLGTVLGMIDVFGVIMDVGVGNAMLLSGGISKALITTAAGLVVAIPALMFYRFYDRRVTRLALAMEDQALRLVEVLNGERAHGVDAR